MTVKTKDRDYQSLTSYLAGAGVMSVLSIAILIVVFSSTKAKESGAIGALTSELGIMALFAFFFLALAGYMLIVLAFPPKVVNAVLKIKDDQTYEDRPVTYMMFDLVQEKAPSYAKALHCACYTEYPNELLVGYQYKIKIIPYNRRILSVEDPDKYSGQEGQPVSTQDFTPKQDRKLEKLASYPVLTPGRIDVEFSTWEEKVIEITKLKLPDYINLESIRVFQVCPARLEKQTARIIFICDEQDNIIYMIRSDIKNPFRYTVCDYAKNPVALIEHKLFRGSYEHIVRIVGKPAFSVQSTMSVSEDYEILGCDYSVMGGLKGSFATTNIFNKDGKMVAEIDPEINFSGMKRYFCRLHEGFTLSPELLLLTFCVTKAVNPE